MLISSKLKRKSASNPIKLPNVQTEYHAVDEQINPHHVPKMLPTTDAHGNGIPIPIKFPWDSHGNGNTNMPKMVMGMRIGRVYVTMGMGMATFSCMQKFPSVDSMRMQSNMSCNVTFFVNDIILS